MVFTVFLAVLIGRKREKCNNCEEREILKTAELEDGDEIVFEVVNKFCDK